MHHGLRGEIVTLCLDSADYGDDLRGANPIKIYNQYATGLDRPLRSGERLVITDLLVAVSDPGCRIEIFGGFNDGPQAGERIFDSSFVPFGTYPYFVGQGTAFMRRRTPAYLKLGTYPMAKTDVANHVVITGSGLILNPERGSPVTPVGFAPPPPPMRLVTLATQTGAFQALFTFDGPVTYNFGPVGGEPKVSSDVPVAGTQVSATQIEWSYNNAIAGGSSWDISNQPPDVDTLIAFPQFGNLTA